MLVLALIFALLPAAITLVLPRLWLLLWIPALIALFFLTLEALQQLDGPFALDDLLFLAVLMFGSFLAAAGRLMVVLAALDAQWRRGYGD